VLSPDLRYRSLYRHAVAGGCAIRVISAWFARPSSPVDIVLGSREISSHQRRCFASALPPRNARGRWLRATSRLRASALYLTLHWLHMRACLK